MLHKEIPFLRILVPLCLGIITGLYFTPGVFLLVVIAIFVVAGFCISLFFNRYQSNLFYGITFTLSMFVFGLTIYTIEKGRLSLLDPEPATFLCMLSDYPEEKENSYKLTVRLRQKIEKTGNIRLNGSLIVYNRKDSMPPSFLPGDYLIIKCTPIEIINRANPNEFDYRSYMENQGIKYFAFTQSSNIPGHIVPKRRNLAHRALIIRESIIDLYRKSNISNERLAIIAAITLGQKNMLDPDQKQNFIKAGVMHIMAVSGLHAMILSLFVFNMLFFLKKRFNLIRVILTILILWLFAFVTGLTPSVLRATLMFSFIQAGYLMQRRVNNINSVLTSAFILILIKPSVIFEAGFLLSYSAVIYIISFYQDLYLKLQPRNRITDFIWKSAVVALIAQAGTLPLTITLFNRFPTYFILTNIIVVPLASLLIVLGCLVPLTFPLHFISKFLASILSFLTGITEVLTEKFSSLPLSTIDNIGMTPVECILLAMTIFLFTWYILKKQSVSIHYPLIALLLLVFTGTVKEISTRTTSELFVYNTIGSSTVGIRTGKMLTYYSDSVSAKPEVLRHGATMRLKLINRTIPHNKCFFRTGGKKILICNSLNYIMLQDLTPDIIILNGYYPQFERGTDFESDLQALIITSEASTSFRLPDNLNRERVDTIHFVRKYGAFRMKL